LVGPFVEQGDERVPDERAGPQIVVLRLAGAGGGKGEAVRRVGVLTLITEDRARELSDLGLQGVQVPLVRPGSDPVA
jgi:hypothetical protein